MHEAPGQLSFASSVAITISNFPAWLSKTCAAKKMSVQQAASNYCTVFEAAVSKHTFLAGSGASVSPRFFAHILPAAVTPPRGPSRRPSPALALPGHIPGVSQTAHGQAVCLTACWSSSCSARPQPCSETSFGWGMWPASSDVRNPTLGCTVSLPDGPAH